MTLKRDSAGDQFCFKISMHMFPLSDIFMWYIRVANVTLGAEKLPQRLVKTEPRAGHGYYGRCSRIVIRQLYIDIEYATFIWAPLWSRDGTYPMKNIVRRRREGDGCQITLLSICNFPVDALYTHLLC